MYSGEFLSVAVNLPTPEDKYLFYIILIQVPSAGNMILRMETTSTVSLSMSLSFPDVSIFGDQRMTVSQKPLLLLA